MVLVNCTFCRGFIAMKSVFNYLPVSIFMLSIGLVFNGCEQTGSIRATPGDGIKASSAQEGENANAVELEALEKELAALELRIDSLIEPPECTDDSECVAIPFGDKACGGFKGYKIASER